MKTLATKKTKIKTTALLTAIELELKAILEDDIRKLCLPKDNGVKNAAFLQLIAA